MTPGNFLAKLVSFPELQLVYVDARSRLGWLVVHLQSTSSCRACPRCASLCSGTYDHRSARALDAPLRDKKVELVIRKKRYYCRRCRKPFTEALHGIFKGARLTERLRRNILWCCSRFQSLLAVSRAMGCSNSTVRRSLYAHLEIHVQRHLSYGFPEQIGIDEHFFGLSQSSRFQAVSEQKYHTTIVDLKRHRLYRAVKDRDQASVFDQLKDEPGAEKVKEVAMDMSEGYRNLVHALFPNARISIDPFHVLRLLQRPLNHERKKIIGRKKRGNPLAKLLLKSGAKLEAPIRWQIQSFLKPYPELHALYEAKERLHRLYRCRGRRWAEKSLDHLLRDLDAQSRIEPLKTLAGTLRRWREEILHHFESGLTNAMTEGFNNKIKLIKRMAYGFRNPDAYNRRILYACYH